MSAPTAIIIAPSLQIARNVATYVLAIERSIVSPPYVVILDTSDIDRVRGLDTLIDVYVVNRGARDQQTNVEALRYLRARGHRILYRHYK